VQTHRQLFIDLL